MADEEKPPRTRPLRLNLKIATEKPGQRPRVTHLKKSDLTGASGAEPTKSAPASNRP